MLVKLMLVIALSGFIGMSRADETSDAKTANIKQLVEITGTTRIAEQFANTMSQQMFKLLKTARPDIPDRALTVMQTELMSIFSENIYSTGGLVDQIIPIYSKHFTNAEIEQLLAFYQTPLGQKVIAAMPQVMNESMLAGQQWGQSLRPEIQKRLMLALQKEGLLKAAK
jgi:uncharacterized protein